MASEWWSKLKQGSATSENDLGQPHCYSFICLNTSTPHPLHRQFSPSISPFSIPLRDINITLACSH